MNGLKRKTALYGLMIALALVLGYVETLLPPPAGVPGVKLGLANLVVVTALYGLGPKDALIVSIARILLAGFTFHGPAALLYSLAGGLVSLGVMILLKKVGWWSLVGVSIAGGVTHNIAQLAVAAVVLHTKQIVWYAPILLISGLVTGAVIGGLVAVFLPRIRRFFPKQ